MPRIAPLKREAIPEAEPIFEHFESVMGFLPNSLLTMGKRPDILLPLAQTAQAIFGTGKVDSGMKHLIAHIASRASGCWYCSAHTANNAANTGVETDKIEVAFEFETHPLFSEAERAALRVANYAALTPNGVTEKHFAELKCFFDDEQIIEIVAMIALYGFLNRWNDTLATELEPAPSQFAEKHLSHSGWEAGKHQP